MIVELVGASGSGKTTVALGVMASLDNVRPGRRSLAKLSGSRAPVSPALGGLFFVPPILLRLSRSPSELGELWRSVQLAKRLKVIALAGRSRVHARSDAVFLHDQGLVQALGYLTRDWPESRRRELIPQLYEAFGERTLPALIVAFSVDANLTSARTKMKGARHQHLDEIKRTTDSLNLHVQLLHERFGVRVTALQNSAELTAAVSVAKTAIAALHGRG
jgi:hypothetical protein